MTKREIDLLVAGIAPDPGPGLTAGAMELMDELTAAPPAPDPGPARRFSWSRLRSGFRVRLAVPLVAGLAAALVVLGWVAPGSFGPAPSQAEALEIQRVGQVYVITVKDLFADPKRYEAQLRRLGLNIRLRVEPVPPSAEGGIFPMYDGMNGRTNEELERDEDKLWPISRPGLCAEAGTCEIGLKVPVGFDEVATVKLGRKARPGERYTVLQPLQAAGGPLHCVPFIGKSVDLVRGLLGKRGITVASYFDGGSSRPSVPGTWYVHEGFMSEPGKATLFVSSTPKRPATPGGPDLSGDLCPRAD
ncbi:hypothetical protein [Bailinhaonella thermotolerans]|uniref:Uncharacterized protein n=1 Tax=Bailinhaonella thermotolerans TaxID=1070861 RepID=A0A3A4B791_9ACTN|nr:hypothetical protein [Bailinhaonella thermotolerans]RJL29968.1 hypothetical protein D5H75_23775 [Bailinhaonella thermotolerans]